MAKVQVDNWDAEFLSRSPMFFPIQSHAEKFTAFQQWPALSDYQAYLEQHPVTTLKGIPLKIVRQDGKPGHFHEHYAPRIYHTGEIQTRTSNWHDFFQYLTWFIFPKTKAMINAVHIPAAEHRHQRDGDTGRRSDIENMLSLFDEGGAVIVSSEPELLELIRNFEWKTLFWDNRDRVKRKLSCITFGHAMYEKALNPYLGMTANSILLEADDSFFNTGISEQLSWVDQQLSGMIQQQNLYKKPKDLQPFPVLGMPGWDKNNTSESYYDNTQYFRTGRKKA